MVDYLPNLSLFPKIIIKIALVQLYYKIQYVLIVYIMCRILKFYVGFLKPAGAASFIKHSIWLCLCMKS